MARSGQRVQINAWVVSSPVFYNLRWAMCGVTCGGCGDRRGGTTMVGSNHRGQRRGAVSSYIPLYNHAVQRTPGARILRDTGSAAGSAPGAADVERYVY